MYADAAIQMQADEAGRRAVETLEEAGGPCSLLSRSLTPFQACLDS